MTTRPGSTANQSTENEKSADAPEQVKHQADNREAPTNGEDRATKERGTAFLVDEFDVQTHDAAELVAEDEKEADELSRHDQERQDRKDDLEGVPTPHSPDEGPVERVQHHMQKDVLHDREA